MITTANHGREPTLGTKIRDAVKKTTPIDPPVQIHQGNCDGGDLNTGRKIAPSDAQDKQHSRATGKRNERSLKRVFDAEAQRTVHAGLNSQQATSNQTDKNRQQKDAGKLQRINIPERLDD